MSVTLPDLTVTCLSEIARRRPRDDERIDLSLRFIGLPNTCRTSYGAASSAD